MSNGQHVPIKYHNRNQTEEDEEELTIAGAFDEAKNLKDVKSLLRDGKMKEFYQMANKVLMIKKNHPVVTKVKTDGSVGDVEVFEERTSVEKAIAGYFTEIYRRPNHMVAQVDDGEQPMTDESPARGE